MTDHWLQEIRERLETKKSELEGRLSRITANVRQSLETDSKERAKQLEDSEVVDALGNEAREELAKIGVALARLGRGEYGLCSECGIPIPPRRMQAYPYANECIECATIDEQVRARSIK